MFDSTDCPIENDLAHFKSKHQILSCTEPNGTPKTSVEHSIDALFGIFFDVEVMGQILLNHSASGGKVEKEELNAFLVLLLLMWAQPQPEVSDYWLEPQYNLTGSLWMPLIMSNKNKWYKVSKAIQCKGHCREVLELVNKKIKENFLLVESLPLMSGSPSSLEQTIRYSCASKSSLQELSSSFTSSVTKTEWPHHIVLYMKEKMAV